MTTTEDYESIAAFVYRLDPLWPGAHADRDATFYTGDDSSKQMWKVIDTAANAQNGFQGMAVVPVVNKVPDYSHIIIAYAGTNFDDINDVGADLSLVGFGNTREGSQAADAMTFAAKVAVDNPGAILETDGHSLGGLLASYVAAEKKLRATAFNAPDAWDALSPEAKKWVKQKQTGSDKWLRNFVNEFDTIGNLKPDGTGARIPVADEAGRDMWQYHNLGKGNSFSFVDGGIVGAGVGSIDYGVILYNLGQTGAAQAYWAAEGNSRYGKVLVAMESAVELANTIGGLAEPLRTITTANTAVEEEMEAELRNAKSAYLMLHHSLTGTDIETCVDTHRLHVEQNIDLDKVSAVTSQVRRDTALISALHDGIHRSVVNALVQDGRAAAGFTAQQPRK
ncbi:MULTISPECIES: hypothetical protein [unclassified Leifsonia]|uniref:hypothetical protein n=1 Tax=unclassified Leifsonia TaxID=2663824 RepID=UPI0008A72A7A|nr:MULTISPECIES: hypothetical protein [unclassified Leifsonia]SEH86066.1 hypothetical protein SAMN04515694_105143 [Leifsonia sp. CL154]SFL48495.1 hypothetical protein SAMN04515692_105143 [Leifsonia sp. CL147]